MLIGVRAQAQRICCFTAFLFLGPRRPLPQRVDSSDATTSYPERALQRSPQQATAPGRARTREPHRAAELTSAWREVIITLSIRGRSFLHRYARQLCNPSQGCLRCVETETKILIRVGGVRIRWLVIMRVPSGP